MLQNILYIRSLSVIRLKRCGIKFCKPIDCAYCVIIQKIILTHVFIGVYQWSAASVTGKTICAISGGNSSAIVSNARYQTMIV